MFNRLSSLIGPLLFFGILVVYVFASFIWWTWVHFENNDKILELRRAYAELQYEKAGIPAEEVTNPSEKYPPNTYYQEAVEHHTSRSRMIILEGLFFLSIVSIGVFQVYSGFKKELLLNQQQRNFLLSITHELKSPLAGIKLAVETMKSRILQRPLQLRLLGNAMKDTDRLKTLVDNILMAAKIENQSITLAYENANLSKLVTDSVQKMQYGKAQNHTLSTNIQGHILLDGDTMALTSIVDNLIENAIKYSPVNTNINVQLSHTGTQAVLEVADNGIGINDADKKKVFTKFYRVGSEDTRTTKGTGLGLYLVKQLVQFHKGTIKIVDNTPQGSIFRVVLPCKPMNNSAIIIDAKPPSASNMAKAVAS